MQILKTSSIKDEFNNNEKFFFEMKLTNKTKIMKKTLKDTIDIIKISFKKIKCRESYICETKYD